MPERTILAATLLLAVVAAAAPPPVDADAYVVQNSGTGEVLASHDEHDTTVEQLLVLNPDVDPVALTVGQRIRVK